LENVENIDGFSETNRVDRTVSVAVVVVHDLKHAGSVKAVQRFCPRMLVAFLGEKQCVPDQSLHIFGTTAKVLTAASHPENRFHSAVSLHQIPDNAIIPVPV